MVNTLHITRTPAAGAAVDSGGHAFRAYGIDDDALILVRPDGHIGLTASRDDAQAVLDYLDRWRSTHSHRLRNARSHPHLAQLPMRFRRDG